MKYIIIIGDGMADDPIKSLGGKTPLEYTDIPEMDKLASTGTLGTAVTIPDGMQAGSDTALMSILGLEPSKYLTGRAPLEAAATGISMSSGDIAYRCNMLSIEDADVPFEEKKIISHSAGSIEGDLSDKLLSDLINTPKFKEEAESAGITFYPGSSFRHIAVQKSPDNNKMKLTAPHDYLNKELGQHLPCGNENAVKLKNLIKLSFEILDSHPINHRRRLQGKLPANCIWFWAEGTASKLPSFKELYGKTGSVISAVPLCQGIGSLIGLEKIIVPGATGELNTNYEGKKDAAIKSLVEKDFVLLHIEAPDECTHNGDLQGKLQAIKWIDSRVLSPLLSELAEKAVDYRMILISDHRTLSSTRGHDSGEVPFILYDSRVDNKTGLRFTEKSASQAGNQVKGTDLMGLLFSK